MWGAQCVCFGRIIWQWGKVMGYGCEQFGRFIIVDVSSWNVTTRYCRITWWLRTDLSRSKHSIKAPQCNDIKLLAITVMWGLHFRLQSINFGGCSWIAKLEMRMAKEAEKFGGDFSLFFIHSWSFIKDTISVEVQIFSSFKLSIASPNTS